MLFSLRAAIFLGVKLLVISPTPELPAPFSPSAKASLSNVITIASFPRLPKTHANLILDIKSLSNSAKIDQRVRSIFLLIFLVSRSSKVTRTRSTPRSTIEMLSFNLGSEFLVSDSRQFSCFDFDTFSWREFQNKIFVKLSTMTIFSIVKQKTREIAQISRNLDKAEFKHGEPKLPIQKLEKSWLVRQ